MMDEMWTLNPQLESLARNVIGAAIEVHKILGPGYLESVYENALSHELHLRDIRHTCQFPIDVNYKGKGVGEGRIDMLVEDQIVLELKCSDHNHDLFEAQVISYLTSARLQLGYVINFKTTMLKQGLQRIIYSS